MSMEFSPWQFNWLDIVLAAILFVAVARSLWTGFSRSVGSLLGIFVGFWVAVHQVSSLGRRLAPFIEDETLRLLTAFCLLFFVVYLGFFIGGILAHGLFKALKLGWIDRFLGAVMGLFKGMVLVGVIVFVLTLFLPAKSPVLRESCLYPRFGQIARAISVLVPDDYRRQFMWKWRRASSGTGGPPGQEV